MRKTHLTTILDDSELEKYNLAFSGIVKERRTLGTKTFEPESSLFEFYRRQISPDGPSKWREDIEFSVNLPGVAWIISRLAKRYLATPEKRNNFPFWHPPTQLDADTILTIWTLIGIAFLNSYYATLLGQLLTFTAREFHASTNAQGLVLGASRLDIVPALILLAAADKIGRTKVILFSTAMGAIFSALGGLSPNISILAADQVATKAFATAAILLVAIVSSEKVPATARAWALASLVIGSALGAGTAAVLLPIAGFSAGSWRILYGLSIFALLLVKPFSKHMTESARFKVLSSSKETAKPKPGSRKTRNALILLSLSSFLINMFYIPASQFRNEFLSHDQGFSAAAISAFTIVTAAPGALGLALGGRLSETRGRRLVAFSAILFGTGGLMLAFLSKGVWIWVWAMFGSIIAPATIPSLGVYGTELFPTKYRGKANGIIGIWSRAGSIVGVVSVGYLGTSLFHNDVGTPLALMGIGPLILAVIVLAAFPETRGLELETINPEDAAFRDLRG